VLRQLAAAIASGDTAAMRSIVDSNAWDYTTPAEREPLCRVTQLLADQVAAHLDQEADYAGIHKPGIQKLARLVRAGEIKASYGSYAAVSRDEPFLGVPEFDSSTEAAQALATEGGGGGFVVRLFDAWRSISVKPCTKRVDHLPVTTTQSYEKLTVRCCAVPQVARPSHAFLQLRCRLSIGDASEAARHWITRS
jgi:hypothetical protein